jgi:hypothetical protein
MSFNAWLYAYANPINLTDPSGRIPCEMLPPDDQAACVTQGEPDPAPITYPVDPGNSYEPSDPLLWSAYQCENDGGWQPHRPSLPLTEDEIRVTPRDIKTKGGLLQYLRSEPEAMMLTRVAIAEAFGSPADRENVMWIIKIRADLGYSNGRHRRVGDPLIRWGAKTSIATEAINPTQFEPIGKANHDYERLGPNFNPIGYPAGWNLRAMLHPTDSQLTDFRATYQAALRVAAMNIRSMPEPNKGYDYFTGNSPIGVLSYALGRPSRQFAKDGNVYRDTFPGDNIYLGLVKCEDVRKKVGGYLLTANPNSYVRDYTCPPGY